ncbi:MAG: sugar transferase [Caldilineales bacterium]
MSASSLKPSAKRDAARLTLALVLLDAAALALALVAAYWLRISSGLLPARAFEEFPVYLRISALLVPIFLLLFFFNNLYDLRVARGGLEMYAHIAKSLVFGVVAVIMVGYWVRIAVLSRGWLMLIFAFGLLFVGSERFLVRRALALAHRRGRMRARALIVGANEQGQAIARQFQAVSGAGVDVVGFIDDFLPVGAPLPLMDATGAALRVLGGPDRLLDVAQQQHVDEVVVVTNAVAWETFQEIMQRYSADSSASPFSMTLSPGFYEIMTTGVQVTHRAYVPLLLVNRERITGADKLLKVALDYSLALLVLLPALPLLGLIGLALRGRGAVIERHQVLRAGGGSFITWKFHTGLGDTPRPGFAHPLANGEDSRDRQIGRSSRLQHLLYSTGLDKLPQLVNILRGEMSWVGPRTVSLHQVELHAPWLPNLLTVKSGITGPWAVGGERTLAEEMRLTMIYIRNWTIWLDLQVLMQTAGRVLRRERGKARLPER